MGGLPIKHRSLHRIFVKTAEVIAHKIVLWPFYNRVFGRRKSSCDQKLSACFAAVIPWPCWSRHYSSKSPSGLRSPVRLFTEPWRRQYPSSTCCGHGRCGARRSVNLYANAAHVKTLIIGVFFVTLLGRCAFLGNRQRQCLTSTLTIYRNVFLYLNPDFTLMVEICDLLFCQY